MIVKSLNLKQIINDFLFLFFLNFTNILILFDKCVYFVTLYDEINYLIFLLANI